MESIDEYFSYYAAEKVDLNVFGIQFSPDSFQTAPTVLTVIFGIITSWDWVKLKGKQATTTMKFGLEPYFMH